MLTERDYMKEQGRDRTSPLPKLVVIRPKLSKMWILIIVVAAAEIGFIIYRSL